jgi:hypothetical protein
LIAIRYPLRFRWLSVFFLHCFRFHHPARSARQLSFRSSDATVCFFGLVHGMTGTLGCS